MERINIRFTQQRKWRKYAIRSARNIDWYVPSKCFWQVWKGRIYGTARPIGLIESISLIRSVLFQTALTISNTMTLLRFNLASSLYCTLIIL